MSPECENGANTLVEWPIRTIDGNPDRAPLKEVLGGQYNYREGEDKCCGKALKAAGGVEVVNVVRIRAPKK